MKRQIQILTALLVVQLVITAVVYWPRSTQAKGLPVFPDISKEDIVALTIEDNESNQVHLVKKGGSWVLPEAGDYPVLESNINEFLDKLLELDTNRLITQTPASHARLQVADDNFLRRVQVETNDGKTIVLYLGSSPRAGATHFRLAKENEVYLTSSLSTLDAAVQPARFIDTTYVSLPPSDVSVLKVDNSNGEMVFRKNDVGEWTLDGLAAEETPDTGAIQALVNRAATLNLARPIGKKDDPACSLSDPAAVVTLTVKKESETKTYTIEVGAQQEDGQHLVRYSGSSYCALVAGFSVSDFVNKTASDFVLQPTATPETSPTPAAGS